MMKRILILSLLCLGFISCTNKQTGCGEAYIGGEIINPNTDFLVLYDNTAPIDTIYLDENNRFSRKIENLNSGLHSFIHGGEYQWMILEPNDSLLLRINTLDFDESIVYTGRGSKKNNYLINLFVALEKEEKKMYEMSKLEPGTFVSRLDTLRDQKKQGLDHFIEKYPNSKLFHKIANASIDFSYYTYKELYPFRHYGGFDPLNYDTLPEDFYSFREWIDYNDEELKDFYPYYNFLFPHINNLTTNIYFERFEDQVFDRNSGDYNLIKLHLIDSLVQQPEIKNNLLKYATRSFLSYCDSPEESEAVCASYFKKSTNEEHADYIRNLSKSIKKLHPGNTFPAVEVTDKNNEIVNLASLIDRPTVVYFWSKSVKSHFINSHKRAEYLREEYPDVNFISVNINPNPHSMWKYMLKQHNFDLDSEFKFRDPEAAKKILAIHYINKVMVVNGDKEIVSSNANIFDKEFKYLLAELK